MIKICLVVAICFYSFTVSGQKNDSLKLVCPLNDAVESRAEKKSYSLGAEEVMIVLTSTSDTIVKACTKGTVTNVMPNGDGTWMVMFNSPEYLFVYSGITKTSAGKGQRLQSGETIGFLKPGAKLEFRLSDSESPLDPKKYLSCLW